MTVETNPKIIVFEKGRKTGMYVVFNVGQTVPRGYVCLNCIPWCAMYISTTGT